MWQLIAAPGAPRVTNNNQGTENGTQNNTKKRLRAAGAGLAAGFALLGTADALAATVDGTGGTLTYTGAPGLISKVFFQQDGTMQTVTVTRDTIGDDGLADIDPITVTGASTNWDVSVTDELPAGVAFVSASAGCEQTGGVVRCAVGDLAVGESAERQIVVSTSVPDAALSNTARAQSSTADPASGLSCKFCIDEMIRGVGLE